MTMLLALGFTSPLMLGGLTLAGIPLVIHLLHRRRFQEVPWAAMRFLVKATEKHARRMRLEQWLLLAVRTLLLAAVILAMAGPAVQSSLVSGGGSTPTLRVLVIDDSLSLGFTTSGVPHFSRAQELARKVIQAADSRDAFLLFTLSNRGPRVQIGRPARQPATVLEEIEQLTVSDGRADLLEGLTEIERTLAGISEFSRKEIVIISDLQESSWWPADTAEQSRFKQKWQQLAELGKLTVLDVGPPQGSNVGVVRLATREPFALTGQPVSVTATLVNFEKNGVEDQPVELHWNGRLIDVRRVALPSRQETAVEFRPVFTATGWQRLEVKVRPDSLDADNCRRLVVPVRDELQVLLVNGKPSGKPMGNATDFLRMAMAPGRANQPSVSRIRPLVIGESELAAQDLSRFDAVFLCNVANVTEREADLLRKYLQAGGGVVWCLGDLVQADNYNRWLLADQKEILPAKLGERMGDPVRREQAFDFDPGDFQHPIVRPFQGNPGAGLELTKTFAYIQCQPRQVPGLRVALRFDTGDPAIVECPVGRGRSILITTSVDREWSTWAVWGHSLIPLMHETVREAQAGRWADRQFLVGNLLSCPGSALLTADVSTQWKTPWGEHSGQASPMDGTIAGDVAQQAGFCELRFGPPVNQSDWVAVDVDPRESEPATLSAEDLQEWGVPVRVSGDWIPEKVTANDTEVGGELPSNSTSTSLARFLLIAAFSLWLAELLLAWNFQLGVTSLAAALVWAFAACWLPTVYASLLLAVIPLGLAGAWQLESVRKATR